MPDRPSTGREERLTPFDIYFFARCWFVDAPDIRIRVAEMDTHPEWGIVAWRDGDPNVNLTMGLTAEFLFRHEEVGLVWVLRKFRRAFADRYDVPMVATW